MDNNKQENAWDSLTKQEQAIFYQKLQYNKDDYYNEKIDRQYLFDINNKIVVTDGDFIHPTVEVVIEFSYKYGEPAMEEAREAFYEGINEGRTINKSVSFVQKTFEKEMVTIYRSNSGWENRKVERQNENVGESGQTIGYGNGRENLLGETRGINGGLEQDAQKSSNNDLQFSKTDKNDNLPANIEKESAKYDANVKITKEKKRKTHLESKLTAESKEGVVFNYSDIENTLNKTITNVFAENNNIQIKYNDKVDFIEQMYEALNIGSQDVNDKKFVGNLRLIVEALVDKSILKFAADGSATIGEHFTSLVDASKVIALFDEDRNIQCLKIV